MFSPYDAAAAAAAAAEELDQSFNRKKNPYYLR